MQNLRSVNPTPARRQFPPEHERLFVRHYDWLLGWALTLTERDEQQAQELVHDAFIQFTLARPALGEIRDPEAYLYTLLRNLHVSQVRRAIRQRQRVISIIDYDSAEIGLRAPDAHDSILRRDQLCRVCHYAAWRKETAKAGSALLLRFFHGYYPGEIALVARCTRAAVEKRLKAARDEARLYLENPAALGFLQGMPAFDAAQINYSLTGDELLREFRRRIFRTSSGACLSPARLTELYRPDKEHGGNDGLDCATLAHLVSCPKCLDAVNQLLGLPPLSERFPTDMTGPEPRGGAGGEGSNGSGTSGGGHRQSLLKRSRQRAQEIFEHRPHELRILVNGFEQAAQRVHSACSEFDLTVKQSEPIEFIEVVSEQELRLLLLNVEPAHGLQTQRVELSGGRSLELSMSCNAPWPLLRVTYHDPLLEEETERQEEGERGRQGDKETRGLGEAELEESSPPLLVPPSPPLLWRWLRPMPITAIVTTLLVAAWLLFTQFEPRPVSAAALLRQVELREAAQQSQPELVIHRTIRLEERRAHDQSLLVRRRIEIWRSAARGVQARRLYDERDQLIAGEWRNHDGQTTLYRRAQQPQPSNIEPGATNALLNDLDTIWRLDLTARAFVGLIGQAEQVVVEERPRVYVIRYERGKDENEPGLARATLTISKDKLHCVDQALTARRNGEWREYHFFEETRREHAANEINPQLFEPEPELLSARITRENIALNVAPAPMTSAAPSPLPALAAPAELEIEVLRLLHQVGADAGEQVSVARAPQGQLRVEALVETAERKREILAALDSVKSHPALRPEIRTVAEALRQQPSPASQSPPTIIESEEAAALRIPVDDELRRFLAERGVSDESLNDEVNRYAGRALDHSRRALRHALALKRHAERFSPAALRGLEATARGAWLSILRSHAQTARRELATLRNETAPVFPAAATNAASPDALLDAPSGAPSLDTLARASAQLAEACAAIDRTTSAAFAISPDASRAAAIRRADFWRALARAERLAAAIERLE